MTSIHPRQEAVKYISAVAKPLFAHFNIPQPKIIVNNTLPALAMTTADLFGKTTIVFNLSSHFKRQNSFVELLSTISHEFVHCFQFHESDYPPDDCYAEIEAYELQTIGRVALCCLLLKEIH